MNLFPPVVGIDPFGVHVHGIPPSFGPNVGLAFEVVDYNHSHLQGRDQVLCHEIIGVSGEYDYIFSLRIGKGAVSASELFGEFFH